MLLGIAIMTAYMPGVIGFVSITSWAVMWLVMPIFILKCKIDVTFIHILGMMFLSYSALSLLWSPHGMLELMQLLALASVFVWGSTLKDLKSVIVGLSIGLAFSSVLAIFQFFGFNDFVYSGTPRPSGLFFNSNIFAEISGMLLLLILINKLWWCIPVTLPGLMVSSRAVILGLGISLAVLYWTKSKALSILTLIVSWLIAYLVTFPSIINISPASISSNSTVSVFQRLYVWQDMLTGFTIFGNGIGSFVYKFPEYNKHIDSSVTLVEYAHNDLLQLIFELGIGAIPLLIIFVLLLMVKNDYKSVFAFFIIIGIFGFPLHMPVTAFMLALVASQLAKSSLGYSDIVNYFRSILFSRMDTARFA
jgi:hypothetical protein